MVQSKTALFKEEYSVNAAYFKALAHPARLQIMQILASSKNCITADISDELPLGRTTVNQHIKELKMIGLIKGHTEGTATKYCLNPEKVNELKRAIQHFLDNFDMSNYTCEAL